MVSPSSALEQFIRSIPLFSLVEPDGMMDLLRLLRPVTLSPGQVLFRQGTPGTAMWVLGTGCEVSVSATPGGARRPIVLAYVKAGEVVGEMALVDDGERSATAVVMQGGTAYQIESIDFHTLRDGLHPVAYQVLRRICADLCARLRATNERVAPEGPPIQGQPPLPLRPAEPADVDGFQPFAKLPAVAKVALAHKLKVLELPGIAPLFGEGDPGGCAYFLTQGEVTVARGGKTLATLGPGQLIGLVSCIDGGRRSATVLSAGPAVLLRLEDKEFDWLFAHGNRVAYQIVELVARQLVTYIRMTNDRVPLVAEPAGTPTPLPPPAVIAPPAPPPEEELAVDVEVLPLELELQLRPEGELLG